MNVMGKKVFSLSRSLSRKLGSSFKTTDSCRSEHVACCICLLQLLTSWCIPNEWVSGEWGVCSGIRMEYAQQSARNWVNGGRTYREREGERERKRERVGEGNDSCRSDASRWVGELISYLAQVDMPLISQQTQTQSQSQTQRDDNIYSL